MISECVALASCLMLTAAQLQMPIQQVLALPNLQPMQLTTLPNSEVLMTQSAHSILNDVSGPISPGILGGIPILVGETAQNILDQESRIVGYTLPAGLQAVLQQSQQYPINQQPVLQQSQQYPINQQPVLQQSQQYPINQQPVLQQSQQYPINQQPVLQQSQQYPAHQQTHESFHSQSQFVVPSPPQIIPITQNDAVNVDGNVIRSVQSQSKPQSLSFPVLNQDQVRQPVNVVPLRAQVSLKSLLTSLNPSDRESFQSNVVHQQADSENVYYDIPPNHPIPPPPSLSKYRESRPNDYDSGNNAPDQSQSHRGGSHYEVNSDEDVVFMRPPPPTLFHSFFRQTEEDINEDSRRPQSQPPKTEELDQYRYREDSLPLPPLPETSPAPPSSTPKSKDEKEKDKSQRRKKPKNRQSKSRNAGSESRASSKLKHTPTQDNLESPSDIVNSKIHQQDADFATQSSESSFLTALLQSQQRNSPHTSPVFERSNNYDYPPSTNNPGSMVHKHIFVHAAPEMYSQGPRVRVIRPPVNQEKHLQIIFVKSPTEAPATETIVELPPAQQPKTLVYILSKKPEEAGGDVKVISPPTLKPHAPEIYFIRYGDRRENQGYPVPDLQSLNLNEDNNNNYHTSNSDQLPVAAPNSLSPHLVSFLRQKRHKDYGLDTYAPLMAYSSTGQINEITQEEANSRKTNLDGFF